MESSRKVLIIDDEPDIREIAKISIQFTRCWEVLTAASGLEGIEISLAKKPDVILLDVLMPEFDGLATLRILKKYPVVQNIPVILLTASRKIAMQPEYSEYDIQGILVKPFDPGTLCTQVEEILGWQAV